MRNEDLSAARDGQDARLTTSEIFLRRALQSVTASPFIAHAELSSKSQQNLRDGLRDFVAGQESPADQAGWSRVDANRVGLGRTGNLR